MSLKNHLKPQRHAFTLIELLVVISIIALLISILLPALSAARTEASKITSVSQARQVSFSLFSYASDNNQMMPFLRLKHVNSKGVSDYRWGRQWSRVLYESGYVSNLGIYWSPGRDASDLGPQPHPHPNFSYWSDVQPNPWSYEAVGYGINVGVVPSTEYEVLYEDAALPMRLDQAHAPPPDHMLLLAESWSAHGSLGGLNGIYTISETRQGLTGRSNRLFNYNGGIVRSYLDGRAHAQGGYTGPLRVSGWHLHVNNPRTHPDELGWNVNWTDEQMLAGYDRGHVGYWSYQSINDGYYMAPWFRKWRSNWYLGFRE